MKKYFITNFNNLSLQKKLLLIISAGILGIYTVFFFCIQYLTRNYDHTLYQTNAVLLSHISSSIESDIAAIETISDNIMANPSIQNNLTKLRADSGSKALVTRRNLYNTLNTYAFYNKYIKSVSLVFPDMNTICVGNDSDLDHFDFDQVEKTLMTSNGRACWFSGKMPGEYVTCTRQIRQIKYLSLIPLASLYIVVDLDALMHDILQEYGHISSDFSFILLSDNQRIYPKASSYDQLLPELTDEFSSAQISYMIKEANQEKKFIISGELSHLGWNYLYFTDYNTIFQQTLTVKFLVFGFSILFCLITLWIIRISIKRILWHLDFLLKKIQFFEKGAPIPITSASYDQRFDEIGRLHKNFDKMTHSVKVLRDENYDKQILLKDTTIKMLQQQINPHFLYNTLDTINWLAQKYGADDISLIAGSLGNLFRISISAQTDLIPLSEELSILDNYITIQQIRFRDRLIFELILPDQITDIYVPKLCIQPLVENALKYSLEYSDDPCTINVTIKDMSDTYLIKVSNTGSRFENDLLQKLRDKTIIPQGSGIGLINIDSRLKLLYGTNYGLSFYNQEEMATVMLTLPKKKEDLSHA